MAWFCCNYFNIIERSITINLIVQGPNSKNLKLQWTKVRKGSNWGESGTDVGGWELGQGIRTDKMVQGIRCLCRVLERTWGERWRVKMPFYINIGGSIKKCRGFKKQVRLNEGSLSIPDSNLMSKYPNL